ncbi:hypothetical protein [Nonomuraea soli]|uniref:Uncharacterized protein n=1 Tax=Nonomuraea soli TaxID=1032476 RepID=A0A7W0CLZ3_9ACTN|nr:hypothetical protein [Nonomuraea soli]MBA2893405.1 hypothetical protein [Nonomuraea soli]
MRTPLTPDEEARFHVVMTELVEQKLGEHGTFRITADTEEDRARWQEVARRVGERSGHSIVSYSNGRTIMITSPERVGVIEE